MLELKGIIKDYVTGDTSVRALKGINLAFRNCEFVSILGASGCGKTTMLNILGGLDCYTEGDLLINGRSTKDFTPSDWDAYRNSCVGFVFQNYNLIGHQSVLSNVELALTLSGISRQERTKRATEALERVGLGEQLHKKPNQLSGGQMQRVAIARAIVNNPEIILADEPTGALDSKTSVQIVDLLKEISKDKLVVMVTHNDQLADDYSTRIIRMKDGEIIGDSEPFEAPVYEPTQAESDLKCMIDNVPKPVTDGLKPAEAEKLEKQYNKICNKITRSQRKKMAKERKASLDKTSMSFATAFNLSLKNLFTKKWRTIMVSVAGSIGIIGIALVLAVSNGFTNYVNKLQSDTLSGFPISISQYTADINALMNSGQISQGISYPKFPNDDKLNVYEEQGLTLYYNKITREYLEYINSPELKALCNDISYSHGMNMNVLTKKVSGEEINYTKVNTTPADMLSSMTGMSTGGYWQELLNNDQFIKSQYNVIEGNYPSAARNADGSFDIAVVVDQYNRISTKTLSQLGLSVDDYENATLSDLLKQDIRLILNNDWFKLNSNGRYYDEISFENYGAAFENGITLRISGIMRISPDAPLGMYNSGIVYPSCITDFLIKDSINSNIGKDQRKGDIIYLPESLLPKVEGNTVLRPGMVIPNIKFEIQGITFNKAQIVEMLCQLVAASEMPTGIQIYPKSFDEKAKVTAYLDAYNKTATDKVLYIDAASIAGNIVEQLISTISIVLVAFAAISLVVSSIMIGIITYISVIERTKEIGILRSIGARKKDISRVFNAETIIIGLAAGLIGVIIALILSFPLNAVLVHLAGGFVVGTLVSLSPVAAIILILISVLLTFISGLFPSRIASKKDPVKALRTE